MNSILKKVLFLLAMFNMTALAAVAEDNVFDVFGRSINRAMNKYFTAEVIFILISCTLILIIIAVLNEARRSNKIKNEMRALAIAKFDLQAEKLNLRLSSATILKRIALRSGLRDLSSILQFSHVFESSVEKYYESEKIDSISEEVLTQISALRKVLGFSPLPRGIALTSTRQFCIGDECTIQLTETSQTTNKETCQVLESDERQWSVSHTTGLQAQTGDLVNMSLTKPGDAEYAFKTQVLRDSGNELVLSHTSDLTRTQQRNWLRVNVNIPVKATIIEDSHMGDIITGRITDLSGGGLGMALPVTLAKDAMLLLNFELPGRGKIVDLFVKVVRVGEPFDGDPSKIVHSAAFAGEIDLAHEKIIQYVFGKQREGLLIRKTHATQEPRKTQGNQETPEYGEIQEIEETV